jgi:hypothetical protein
MRFKIRLLYDIARTPSVEERAESEFIVRVRDVCVWHGHRRRFSVSSLSERENTLRPTRLCQQHLPLQVHLVHLDLLVVVEEVG